jgi:hypothetical protein
MLFGQNRDELRRFYVSAWKKHKDGATLEPLERLIVDVINIHPEYQLLLEDEERALTKEWSPESGESNPFAHMGMHIAIREQLITNRPEGIGEHHRRLTVKLNSDHEAEHLIMECMGKVLWEAQQSGALPDERVYLDCLKRL